jgi:hypothetical protein
MTIHELAPGDATRYRFIYEPGQPYGLVFFAFAVGDGPFTGATLTPGHVAFEYFNEKFGRYLERNREGYEASVAFRLFHALTTGDTEFTNLPRDFPMDLKRLWTAGWEEAIR